MAYTIKQHHGNYNTEGRLGSVTYIVCHYTGAGNSSGGNALANCKYFAGGNRNASAHYFIDDEDIYEYADPKTKTAWHCGDGNGRFGITNSNSIGIEVCMDGDNPYTSAEIDRLTWLVQKLMKDFNVSADHVVRHYDASRKACPFYYTPYGSGGDAAWEKLRKQITSGVSSGATGTVVMDTASAYGLGINKNILFPQEEITPYVITIDEKTPELNYDKLKEADVVGVIVNAGTYFDDAHLVRTSYKNAKLDNQVQATQDAEMPFGLYTTIKSKSLDEAKEEFKPLRAILRKYNPQLGVWFKLALQEDKKTKNASIIRYYYDQLVELGYYDQVGFYGTKKELDRIEWEDYQEYWYWWLDKHLEELDDIHQLPTPKFFAYEDPDDKLITPNVNVTEWSQVGGASGGFYSDANATAAQKKVAHAAEFSNNVNLQPNWCAAFVSDCYQEAGFTRPGGNAIDFWDKWSGSGGTAKTGIPIGATVCGSGSGYMGSIYGHVGIMLSGGRVADNIGGRHISNSIDEWASWQSATCRGHTGYIGWVWPNNQDLSKIK